MRCIGVVVRVEEWGISAWRRDGGCRIEGTVRRLEVPEDVVEGILKGVSEGESV